MGGLLPTDTIDESIYVMPAFATIETADLAAMKRWYADALGFIVLAELPPGDRAALVHLRRYRYQDLLLVRGPNSAGTGTELRIRLTFAAGDEDLETRARRAREVGGGSVEGPAPTRWNTIDLVCHDPDGHVVVLTALAPVRQHGTMFSPGTLADAVDRARAEREG